MRLVARLLKLSSPKWVNKKLSCRVEDEPRDQYSCCKQRWTLSETVREIKVPRSVEL